MVLDDLATALREGGSTVGEFTGIEAVEAVAAEDPFMILLDVSLGGQTRSKSRGVSRPRAFAEPSCR